MDENSNVERLAVRPVAPRAVAPEPTHAFDPAVLQNTIVEALRQFIPVIQQTARTAATEAASAVLQGANNTLVGVFHAIAQILAVRLILLLAVVGGFALAVMVLQSPTPVSAAILAGYVVSTVWPLVWLNIAGKRKSGDAQ